MKHTKKMIMVPEVEYATLMNMIKGDKPLLREKAETETQIKKVLHDPKLSELVKGKKYDLLMKQRHNLKNELKKEAEKPTKVLLDEDQLKSIGKATTPRYMGVALTEQQKPSTSRVKKKPKVRKRAAIISSSSDDGGEIFKEPPSYIIHPNYYNDVVKILKNKKQTYGINEKNELNGLPDSNITEILDYLSGKEERKPGGTDAFLDRVKNEKWWKENKKYTDWHRQHGDGKRKKEKSLRERVRKRREEQKKKFKPLIWARL